MLVTRCVNNVDSADYFLMTDNSPIITDTTGDRGLAKITPALVGGALVVVLVTPFGYFIGGVSTVFGLLAGGIVALANLALIGMAAAWATSIKDGSGAGIAVSVTFIKLPILLLSVWFVATRFDALAVAMSIAAVLIGATIAVIADFHFPKTA